MQILCEIVDVRNRKTGQQVVQHYYNKPIKEVIFEVGESLRVIYETGAFFTHETVEKVLLSGHQLIIDTTNKRWIFEYGEDNLCLDFLEKTGTVNAKAVEENILKNRWLHTQESNSAVKHV